MKPALLIALLAVSSYAGEPSYAPALAKRVTGHGQNQLPGEPRFLTKTQIATLSINALAMAADVVTTRRALQVPGAREANPIMQGNTAILFKVGEVALVTVISYQLYRHGHTRMARILPLITASPSIFAAVHNSQVR